MATDWGTVLGPGLSQPSLIVRSLRTGKEQSWLKSH